MKRSLQEIAELTIFGIIALTIATFALWVLGHVLQLVGWLAVKISWLIWWPLKYLVVIAVIVVAIYAIYKILQDRSRTPKAQQATILTHSDK